MSDLNVIDSSVQLFSIDKPIIVFQINPNNNINVNISNSSHNPVNMGQTFLTVTNLSSEYLAFRTKTTKKKYYSVFPSYCIINPNDKQKIDFSYYIKEGEKVSNAGHKFRFEGFVITSDEKDQDPRLLFNKYISEKIPVKASLLKSGVNFIEKEINNNIDKNTIIGNPLSSNSLGFFSEKSLPHPEDSSMLSKENPLISTFDKNKIVEKLNEKSSNFDLHNNEFGTPKRKKYNSNSNKKLLYEFASQKTEEEINALLNNLKVEYFKLKNELDILMTNYYNLRNHVDLEENNQDDLKEENIKNNYPLYNSKEIKLSQPICFVLFLFGVIIGFYLS